jgi:hypothetical protein
VWGNAYLRTLLSEGRLKDIHRGLVLLAHVCNSSYLGDRGQQDKVSKPAQEIIRETFTKMG